MMLLVERKLKTEKIWQILFSVFMIAIFLIEGLGIPEGRLLTFHLILVMPFFLLISDLISGMEIGIPFRSVFMLLMYLVFVSVSVLLGASTENSYGALMLTLALALVFISVFNHKSIERTIAWVILFLCFCFIIYMVFLQFSQDYLNYLVPQNGYQFVYSKFGSHNHLGDFLVLGIVVSIYKYIFEKKRKLYLGFIVFFSIFLLVSFSRSAYVSFILSTGSLVWLALSRKEIKFISFPVVYLFGAFFISMILFFAVVLEASSVPVLKDLNSFMRENMNLKSKTFLSRRDDFAGFALESISKNPVTGVGLGNFVTLATRDADAPYRLRPLSSHNIFLDVLAESGVFALGSFLLFLVYIFYGAIREMKLNFFLLIAMLINFQTDYTHTIYSFLLLFFVLLGLNDKNKLVTRFGSGLLVGVAGVVIVLSLLV